MMTNLFQEQGHDYEGDGTINSDYEAWEKVWIFGPE